MGVSVLIVALTVVAFGTSAPEIVVSGMAAWQGKVELSMGNVLGSNVANVGLVLGTSALILPRVLEAKIERRDMFWMFASLALLWWLSADGCISRVEAIVLLAVFAGYNLNLFIDARTQSAGLEAEVQEAAGDGERRWPVLWVLLGIAGISYGAYLVLEGASAGAERLGMPQSVVGLTVVAIGTSLPELAAGVGGALKGESDISVGNVLGSNVFNLLGVVGIVGVIQPLDPSDARIPEPDALRRAFDFALSEDFYVVAGFSLAALVLTRVGGGGRLKGALLLLSYVAYSAWLVVSRA